jgi:hypothetical protein
VKKNASVATKSASARIWTSFAKAASMSNGACIQDVDVVADAAGGGLYIIQLDFGPRDSCGVH